MPFKTQQIVRSGVNWKRLVAGRVTIGTSGSRLSAFVRTANDLVARRIFFAVSLSYARRSARRHRFSQHTILLWRGGRAGRYHRDARIARLSRRRPCPQTETRGEVLLPRFLDRRAAPGGVRGRASAQPAYRPRTLSRGPSADPQRGRRTRLRERRAGRRLDRGDAALRSDAGVRRARQGRPVERVVDDRAYCSDYGIPSIRRAAARSRRRCGTGRRRRDKPRLPHSGTRGGLFLRAHRRGEAKIIGAAPRPRRRAPATAPRGESPAPP